MSHLAAALGGAVFAGEAVADVNTYLPFATVPTAKRRDLEMSPPAQSWADNVRGLVERILESKEVNSLLLPRRTPIALVDSGVDPEALLSGRRIDQFDYSEDETVRKVARGRSVDTCGHGTRVARVLDACLPKKVDLVSAKLGNANADVTALRVARTYADVVSRTSPAVVNLSLAPVDDSLVCPGCGETCPIPPICSQVLPFVFRLAGATTITVMAAGNSGQRGNSRFVSVDTRTLVLASALDSTGKRASYSSAVGDGVITAHAFGGDNKDVPDGVTMFKNQPEAYGTSFAAPFVSAAIYPVVLAKRLKGESIAADTVFGPNHHRSGRGWLPDWFHDREYLGVVARPSRWW